VNTLDPKDLRIDVFRNEVEARVRIVHTPTGTVVTGHDPQHPTSSLQAKAIAIRELAEKLGKET
jgi:protein subunit release factor A